MKTTACPARRDYPEWSGSASYFRELYRQFEKLKARIFLYRQAKWS